MCKLPLHGPRNFVNRTWELSANYGARTFPYYRAKPKIPQQLLHGSPELLTGDEKFRKMFSIEFYQKLLYLQVSHTARLQPSQSSTPTIVSNILQIPKQFFVFVSSPKKQTHTVCNNRPNIVDLSYRGRTAKLHFGLAPQQEKVRALPIVRTFGRHSCVARATVQRRFPHPGKFQKLFNDRGEIISNLGYSTSFPPTKNNSVEIAYINNKKIKDILSINSPRKLMEEYQFLAPIPRLAISSALLSTLHNKCKKATELPGQTSSLIGQKNIFLPNQRD